MNAVIRTVLSCIVLAALSLPAQAFNLNGAWATDSDICPKVFSKTTKSFSFQKNSEDHGKAFIVEGNKVRGQRVTCDIKSRKENGDETRVTATCATEIMIDQVQLRFKTINDNRIARIFPDIGGLNAAYVRCAF